MLDIEIHLVRNLGALASRLGGLGEVDEGKGQDQQDRNGEALQVCHGEEATHPMLVRVDREEIWSAVRIRGPARGMRDGGELGPLPINRCQALHFRQVNSSAAIA